MAKDRNADIRNSDNLEVRLSRAEKYAPTARTDMAAVGYFITAVRGSNVTGPQYLAAYVLLKTVRVLTKLPGKLFISKDSNWVADVFEGMAAYFRNDPDRIRSGPEGKLVYGPNSAPYIDTKATADLSTQLLGYAMERVVFKYSEAELKEAEKAGALDSSGEED